MISVRLHLDECNEENGALRVIPGSHHRGRTPEEAIASLRLSARELACPVGIGRSIAYATTFTARIIAVQNPGSPSRHPS
jgi:hypothetical protein